MLILIDIVDILKIQPKTIIKVFHLAGLALGLGGAVLLDMLAIRFLIKQKISAEFYEIFKHSSQVVFWGLCLLWLSGIAYLIYYYLADYHSLFNQKVWAKLFIVVILSVNGWWIHRRILPLMQGSINGYLFKALSVNQRRVLLCSSVISILSWGIPLLLGACKELNFCISAFTILFIYFSLLIVGLITACALPKYVHGFK
ncbi:hypothetical protein BEN74_17190 [Acinetobacter sp. WCHAc010034]|uniref:hypothetical protein n=1 Tax=Acinetobacter sp. WCHAc010034 TaxID=1879049 RepID=UPI000839E461|nr:hypothetical protein [Acinetobacter sp. WCHAc010034]AYA04354.1 hypothetical protein BEN74_17190 [Acinetobacter sp. WCHAc010034]